MNFNVVVGNPPYNSDIYLEFIRLAEGLAGMHSYVIPAKWQVKANSEFMRLHIQPHISHLVYYPSCGDVFEIRDPGGICYYKYDKHFNGKAIIENRAELAPIMNNISVREIDKCLNNLGHEISRKITCREDFRQLMITQQDKYGRYEVWLNNKIAVGSNWECSLYAKDGKFYCLSLVRIIDTLSKSIEKPDDSSLVFASSNLLEAQSFKSYLDSKFVRYLVSCSIGGLSGVSAGDTWWRYVPTPELFDHIFTDKELYEKYNLTYQEINVIESLIKER